MHGTQQQLEGLAEQGAFRPKVVHCMSGEHYDKYAGRGRCPRTGEMGELGNRYTHRPSKVPGVVVVPTLEEAVERHKREFWELICSGALPLEKLAALDGLTFGCWCHKPPCHAYTIAAGAAWAAATLARSA
jgi:hypothetical protein